jgi:DNA recombination protein RmuC
MSSPIQICFFLLLGIVLGALGAGLFFRTRFTAERNAGHVECEAKLQPQISALDSQVKAGAAELDNRAEKLKDLEVEKNKLLVQIGDDRAEISRLETIIANEIENARRRREDETTLSDRFAALSNEALRTNSSQFIELAKKSFEKEQEEALGNLNVKHEAFLNVIKPVETTMTALNQRVERLSEDKERLAIEAKNLSNALRRADIRGRWGELQLQRVAELAGMQHRCDFSLQESFQTEEERRRRPDMVVSLPLGRYVVVDSKAVMDAYIYACETTDSAANAEYLVKHAKLVRDKIDELARTDYAKVLGKKGRNVADMVVCYIPGEAFFSAAIAQDPTLLEYAAQKRIFLASPTILITLLRAIALGWRDHQLSANAEEISRLGKELYARLSGMKMHFDKLGDGVRKSVESYNSMVSSLNRMVFPQARRFKDLGATEAGTKEISESPFVEENVRQADSADWDLSLSLVASEDPSSEF